MVFKEGVWHNNPIFGMMLGLCSTLAVTNLVSNALVMSIAVTLVLVVNSAIISSLRNLIPERVRMIAYMLIISSLVITVDMVLKIVLPEASKALGPYVALIITNCILMGRAEAYAINNTVGLSVSDALGVGLGYTFSLTIISIFRELIGFGSILGFAVLPDQFPHVALFTIPPGAFFALGTFILIINAIRNRGKKS
ncbi:MAG: NADH:ubiquinone reductase (Na(+)-transporting) subunit D [Spirochaetes bacterium]|nr:MAG: NADH:ubiquinone reductase (Na(+)-transporting) subunit D [Spirochaetota bacterium]RKX87938.1 MAG: NADH:ubiquinone reductase (Na(+)-transporting) subunit D [Spirochaetota bacterium]RKX93382.1 MAG: NADH:ubiquinone reductase (Na(+)-transporting) subunit D [Spirochaetota bacterium]